MKAWKTNLHFSFIRTAMELQNNFWKKKRKMVGFHGRIAGLASVFHQIIMLILNWGSANQAHNIRIKACLGQSTA